MMRGLYISIVVLTVLACAKWVSVDISGDEIELISPLNDQADSIQNKTFVWHELKGANQYQIQVVSPQFDSALSYVVDSLISNPSYSLTLIPGSYQWRVRGVNDDFESKWSTRDLTIKSTASLANQTITGITPNDGTNSNELPHTFSWNGLIAAQYYSVIVKDENDVNVEVGTSTGPTFSYEFLKEGLFSVHIKAINDISASVTESISIRIDTTSPAGVGIVYPNLDTVRDFPQIFTWTNEAINEGSSITNNLLIASDSLMNNVLLDTSFIATTSMELDSIETSGKFYWQVNRADAAGNKTIGSSASFWIE